MLARKTPEVLPSCQRPMRHLRFLRRILHAYGLEFKGHGHTSLRASNSTWHWQSVIAKTCRAPPGPVHGRSTLKRAFPMFKARDREPTHTAGAW